MHSIPLLCGWKPKGLGYLMHSKCIINSYVLIKWQTKQQIRRPAPCQGSRRHRSKLVTFMHWYYLPHTILDWRRSLHRAPHLRHHLRRSSEGHRSLQLRLNTVHGHWQHSVYQINHLDGFFPTLGTISNAVCVSECPTSSKMTVTCLTDTSKCTSGSITATY